MEADPTCTVWFASVGPPFTQTLLTLQTVEQTERPACRIALQASPRGHHEAGVRVARLVIEPTNADPDLHETYFMKRSS